MPSAICFGSCTVLGMYSLKIAIICCSDVTTSFTFYGPLSWPPTIPAQISIPSSPCCRLSLPGTSLSCRINPFIQPSGPARIALLSSANDLTEVSFQVAQWLTYTFASMYFRNGIPSIKFSNVVHCPRNKRCTSKLSWHF